MWYSIYIVNFPEVLTGKRKHKAMDLQRGCIAFLFVGTAGRSTPHSCRLQGRNLDSPFGPMLQCKPTDARRFAGVQRQAARPFPSPGIRETTVVHDVTAGDDIPAEPNNTGKTTGGAGAGFSPDDLRRLARLVEENNLSELRYEEGDLRVTLRTAAFTRPAYLPAVPPTPQSAAAPFAEGGQEEFLFEDEDEAGASRGPAPEDANLVRIEAPVMGVFYRSPAPNEPPFVEIGDPVEVGQIIGMIEAMKVFSEVPTEVAGVIRDIPGRNGALVQPGDPLVILEPDS